MSIVGCGKTYVEEETSRTIELPAGTQLFVSPVEPVDLEQAQPGTLFAGMLTQPLVIADTVIAPIGSPVAGELVVAERADDEEFLDVGITLTRLTIHGGEEVGLQTAAVYPQPGTAAVDERRLDENAKMVFVLQNDTSVTWKMDLTPVEEDSI